MDGCGGFTAEEWAVRAAAFLADVGSFVTDVWPARSSLWREVDPSLVQLDRLLNMTCDAVCAGDRDLSGAAAKRGVAALLS